METGCQTLKDLTEEFAENLLKSDVFRAIEERHVIVLENFYTALHSAAYAENSYAGQRIEIIKRLIKNGAGISLKNLYGETFADNFNAILHTNMSYGLKYKFLIKIEEIKM
jgi:hypothetical protein